MSSEPRDMGVPPATRFAPLVGLGVGALSGGVYCLAVQVWPSSIAVMLSILTGALLTNELRQAAPATRLDVLSQIFYVLIKYNVLMALSAASLPFAAPANTALWLIMICGYGSSRALLMCVVSSRKPSRTAPLQAAPAAPLSHTDLVLALLTGFAPAALLGLPGWIGLASAVLCVIGLMSVARGGTVLILWSAELCFYLGAQASWRYV